MTRSNVRSRGPRTVVHVVAAIALVAVACDTPLQEAPELSKQELEQNDKAEGIVTLTNGDSIRLKVLLHIKEEYTDKPLYIVDGVVMHSEPIDIQLDIETN